MERGSKCFVRFVDVLYLFILKKTTHILSCLKNVKLKSVCRKVFSRTVHRKEMMYQTKTEPGNKYDEIFVSSLQVLPRFYFRQTTFWQLCPATRESMKTEISETKLHLDVLPPASTGYSYAKHGVGGGRATLTTQQTVVACWNVPQVVIMNMGLDTQPANIPTAPGLIWSCIECSVLTQ